MNLQEVFIKRMADHLKVVKSMKWHQNIVVNKWLFWKKIVKRSFLFIKFVNIEHTSTLNQLTNKDIGYLTYYNFIQFELQPTFTVLCRIYKKSKWKNVSKMFTFASFAYRSKLNVAAHFIENGFESCRRIFLQIRFASIKCLHFTMYNCTTRAKFRKYLRDFS